VEEARGGAAAGIELAVGPNPCRGEAEVRLDLPRSGQVRVAIFDLRGRQVRALHEGALAAGPHRLRWDGRDASGLAVPPGVFWVRAAGGRERGSAKFVLLP
jgi:flagellar hook assembly protein FlgD